MIDIILKPNMVHARFVRGDHLLVKNMPTTSMGVSDCKVGDSLVVSKRKKGGWLRVRNQRMNKVITVRTGDWLSTKAAMLIYEVDRTGAAAAAAARLQGSFGQCTPAPQPVVNPVSTMDQLIRAAQLEGLNNQIKALQQDLERMFEVADSWEQKYNRAVNVVSTLEKDLDIERQRASSAEIKAGAAAAGREAARGEAEAARAEAARADYERRENTYLDEIIRLRNQIFNMEIKQDREAAQAYAEQDGRNLSDDEDWVNA